MDFRFFSLSSLLPLIIPNNTNILFERHVGRFSDPGQSGYIHIQVLMMMIDVGTLSTQKLESQKKKKKLLQLNSQIYERLEPKESILLQEPQRIVVQHPDTKTNHLKYTVFL